MILSNNLLIPNLKFLKISPYMFKKKNERKFIYFCYFKGKYLFQLQLDCMRASPVQHSICILHINCQPMLGLGLKHSPP